MNGKRAKAIRAIALELGTAWGIKQFKRLYRRLKRNYSHRMDHMGLTNGLH